jgi:hypothetical protein
MEKAKDNSRVPEDLTGVPKELASEVTKEQVEPLAEATGDAVPPTPPARMMKAPAKMRAWEYWSS